MSTTKASGVQNGVQPERLDSVRSPSLQQHGGRRSLLERLKTDMPHNTRRLDAAPKKPEYVDVTAAFFARDRCRAPQVKHSTPLQHESPRHGSLFSEKEQRRQQHSRNHPQDPRTPESPLARELKQNIATEAGIICSNGSDKLNNMYEALTGSMADAGMEDDRVLAMIESHHREVAKPLSETMVQENFTTIHHKPNSNNECHLGRVVDSVRERIKTLEAEVGQLWNEWEAAEQEVQDILVSVTGGDNSGPMGQNDSTQNAQKSLALELDSFDEELLRIIEESHEAAKVSEKDFGKKINGVMNALLQQYLLGD